MVERCPDKTEVDGPIPSTLTMCGAHCESRRPDGVEEAGSQKFTSGDE